MHRILGLFLFLIVAGIPVAAPAQEQSQESFSDTLDVQAVNVEVVVTDKRGRRVEGLTAADFRLLVDGQEVPLEYFAEIRDAQAVASPDQKEAPLPGPPPLQPGQEIGNSYLIFIEEIFTQPKLRDEALKGISREVGSLRPQDRVAIVAFNGRRIKVLCPWTRGGPHLEQLMTGIVKQNGSLAESGVDLQRLDPSSNRLFEAYDHNLDQAYAAQSSYFSRPTDLQARLSVVQMAVSAAAASLRAFAAAPGRKVMLLLSGGWPYDPPVVPWSTWEQAREEMKWRQPVRRPGAEDMLLPLIETANLLGFTVYPVYTTMGPPSALPDASYGGGLGGGMISPFRADGSLNLQSRFFTAELMDYAVKHNALAITAEKTGGKLLMPGRNRHLSRVLADTSSYYWLGFTHSGDDRRRALKVEVRREGMTVRSRSSFVPLSRNARMAMEVESALMTGESTGMGALGVSIGDLRKAGADFAKLPVTVRVPADQISFVEQSGRFVGQLEFRIGALDDLGDRSDIPVIPIQISQPEPPRPGTFVRYDTIINLRNVPQDLQFVLHDLLSGKAFAERVRVVPKD